MLIFILCFFVSEENLNCKSVKNLCNQIMSDYNTANDLVKEFPDKIIFLRYETFAYHPYDTLDVLYSFLNLRQEPRLDEYLTSRTGMFRNGTRVRHFRYNKRISTKKTKKKSSIEPSMKWTWQFSSKNIAIVERACNSTMQILGYSKFKKEFRTSGKHILFKKWKDIWPTLPSIYYKFYS